MTHLTLQQNASTQLTNNNNNQQCRHEELQHDGENENAMQSNVLVWEDPETPKSGTSDSDVSSVTMSLLAVRQDGANEDEGSNMRQGTLMSARMNLLTSMVGGGSLSLPLAFHQAGNVVTAPICMIVIAILMECSIQCLIASGIALSKSNHSSSTPTNNNNACTKKKGTVTLEQVACAAFGPPAKYATMALVFLICFFTIVGYGVLLRDLLQPLTDLLGGGHTLANAIMSIVVLLVTPLTTLTSLTALRNVGAFSMLSVLIMASCVSFRAIQCNCNSHQHNNSNQHSFTDYLTYVPHSLQDVLQSLPIFISVYVCHFNVLPVHNELRNPTPSRINSMLRSTYAACTVFYIALGTIGSMYGNCIQPPNHLLSNILKSFPDNDPLILLGRVALTLTIALAFPMLVVPARNVILGNTNNTHNTNTTNTTNNNNQQQQQQHDPTIHTNATNNNDLQEKLLPNAHDQNETQQQQQSFTNNTSDKWKRRLVAILITWSATAIACCVSSIAIVWDFLGSSLSIMLAFVLPCGSYLMLVPKQSSIFLRIMAWTILLLSLPIMIIGTSNAFYTTFIKHEHD